MQLESAESIGEAPPRVGPSTPIERRRVRYRAAEDHVLAAAKLLDDTPGDREIDELLGMAMAKLMARGRR